jgi:predicted metalloprotease
MGPFYCPADETIYIDTSFYDQLDRELGAGGDFARYYVVAHEFGHHVQTITGVADQIRSAQSQNPQQANQLQVLMELQADCYAGVWAGKNRNAIEPGDFEEGMTAASAIGDDTLMRRAGQAVSPESFTHGTSEQRMQALRLGLESGADQQCDRIVQLR